MAQKQTIVILRWENGKSFEMLAQEEGAQDYITVVKLDENSDIAALWDSVQTICETYLKKQIAEVGAEMKE